MRELKEDINKLQWELVIIKPSKIHTCIFDILCKILNFSLLKIQHFPPCTVSVHERIQGETILGYIKSVKKEELSIYIIWNL